ncbi:hypothetical protein [Leisingera methylohalidivorans]|uniref:Uncharacterized protein n=1 Tax=Leisingera methylohalidivorans DSM 14336 TaxID=999552 RepID=V9VZY6_9RHOB|nr:hypothetical protein [Leisingera methylohalidivorans]AHD02940.1 hypothetical protein METH_06795 [Leisingera methylohalidivorans DSM 14336]
MGKGSETRARARKLEARRALPGLAPVPRRERDGNSTRSKRTAEVKAEAAADVAGLKVRARQMGADPNDLPAMRAQALGEAAGQAIYMRHSGAEAAKLWDIYAGLTAAEARYAKIVLGVPIHARVAKVEFLPERLETCADDDLDLRSEEEKHRDAVNAWMRWRGYVQNLSAHHQSAIFAVVRGRKDPVREAALTPAGKRFLDALKLLAEVVDK